MRICSILSSLYICVYHAMVLLGLLLVLAPPVQNRVVSSHSTINRALGVWVFQMKTHARFRDLTETFLPRNAMMIPQLGPTLRWYTNLPRSVLVCIPSVVPCFVAVIVCVHTLYPNRSKARCYHLIFTGDLKVRHTSRRREEFLY